MPKFATAIVPFALLASTASAVSAEPSAKIDAPHTTVELISEREATAPGASQWIGIYFKPRDGWHVYWKNPGDSGLPPRAEFSSTPEGSRFGPLEFMTPDRIPYGPLVNFGYDGDVLYPAKWTAPENLVVGENATVSVNLKWLICKEECVPGRATLSLKLPVTAAEGLPKISGTHSKIVASAVAAIARPPGRNTRLALSPDGANVEILYTGPEAKGFPKSALRHVFFFPEGEYGIGTDAKQVATLTSEGISLIIPRKEKKPVGEIRGILKVAENRSVEVAEVLDPKLLAKAGAPGSAPSAAASSSSLPLMVLFAFIGGLILNLMPCILPVLSIKVLGLANQSGADRGEIRKHGLVFTLGILVSFWILAAILLSVRASGQTLGWGFQLQNPIFVGSLAVLFHLMALNLFGVFEIGDRVVGVGGKLAQKEGFTGSFFTGVLTTVAATPCSAPFMGSALGFALTQSAAVAILVLTSLAFGLAFPYLLFSFMPAATRILPRPGMWMKTLKEILAFPLVATVVWLASVIGNQAGTEGVTMILTVLFLATVVAWLYGKPTAKTSTSAAKWAAIVVALLYGVSILSALGKMRSENVLREGGKSPLVHEPWEQWSPTAQAEALTAGKTVLVNFTAEWCVTCKVNETVVFDRDVVKSELARPNRAALLADWTNGDPTITAALAQVGRNSVPVYLVFKPGAAEPQILPQILSVEGLLKALE